MLSRRPLLMWRTQGLGILRRRAAFEYAVSIWEILINSTTAIDVVAEWAPLEENILGGAGPADWSANFANAPLPDTWYPNPLANSLAGIDLAPAKTDIEAVMNSARTDWYLGN